MFRDEQGSVGIGVIDDRRMRSFRAYAPPGVVNTHCPDVTGWPIPSRYQHRPGGPSPKSTQCAGFVSRSSLSRSRHPLSRLSSPDARQQVVLPVAAGPRGHRPRIRRRERRQRTPKAGSWSSEEVPVGRWRDHFDPPVASAPQLDGHVTCTYLSGGAKTSPVVNITFVPLNGLKVPA